MLDDIYNKEYEKGNSILLELDKFKYMFIGDCVYTFKTTDEIIKFSSNLGINNVHYPFAYGKDNIYFLVDRHEFIPYNSIENENIKNMDLTYDAYNFLYNTNDGERYDILEINMIVPDEEDNTDMHNFIEYIHEMVEEIENNNNNE